MLKKTYALPSGALAVMSSSDPACVSTTVAAMNLIEVADGALDPALMWWNGTAIADRPAPPAPPALVAGVEAVWTGLPPGAVVTLDPMNGATPATVTASAEGTISLTLPAWTWRVSVNEVFPALAASWVIEVAP